jgi:glycosyltransferase involved in cell wall biosynthesis
MKRVLIITNRFPPSFGPRMGYLAKYLPENGWDSDIITINDAGEKHFKTLVGENRIYRVNLKNAEAPKSNFEKFWRLLNMYRHFKNNQIPLLKAALSNMKADEYSVILVSTAWDMFVLQAGSKLAKKWRKPLIVDLRDIHEQRPLEVSKGSGIRILIFDYFKKRFICQSKKMRNNALLNAQAITTVSEWHVEQLKQYNEIVYCIYNGYDPAHFFPYPNAVQNQFKIIYTGSVNTIELRDPTFLFEAVYHLYEEKIIHPKLFRIQFYIPDRDVLLLCNLPIYKKIESFVDFFRYEDTALVPGILNRSSLVLLLTNLSNVQGPKGVMTTKLFEAIAVERPILCVRSDEALIEQAIIKSGAGVSARSVEETKVFILDKWNEWKEKGYTTANVNQEYKKQFSRKLQARQFVEVFEKVMQTNKIIFDEA